MLLGFIFQHPIDNYDGQLCRVKVRRYSDLCGLIDNGQIPDRVNLAGLVISKQIRTSQRGKKFAYVQFSDQTGVFEVMFFQICLIKQRVC